MDHSWLFNKLCCLFKIDTNQLQTEIITIINKQDRDLSILVIIICLNLRSEELLLLYYHSTEDADKMKIDLRLQFMSTLIVTRKVESTKRKKRFTSPLLISSDKVDIVQQRIFGKFK